MSFATPADLLDRLATRHGRNLFVHWGFWCNVTDDTQRKLCADALVGRQAEVYREYRERDYQFRFYRITKPELAEPDEQAPTSRQ
jgi:hypothetical protein